MQEFYLDLVRRTDRHHITVIATAENPYDAMRAAERRHPKYIAEDWFPMSVLVNFKPDENTEYITAP
jgi:glucuronate isomerase